MSFISKIKVADTEQLNRIHTESINVLEKTGIVFESEAALALFKKHGVPLEGHTVFIPGELAEKAMEAAPETFQWQARNPENTVICGEGIVPTPNIGPVFCQDLDNGRRPGTLEDYIRFQQLSQASKIIKTTGATPVAPSNVSPAGLQSLMMFYQAIKHTDKPVQAVCDTGFMAQQQLKLLELSMGPAGYLENHVCTAVSCNPLSPLTYGTHVIENLMTFAQHRQAVFLLPCIMAGVTGPASLWGTIVQQNAEILAGAALTHLVHPEAPIVYCPASTTSDMRYAGVAYSAPEQFLINIPGLQLAHNLYKVPTRVLAGMTSSKIEDIQAGSETMMNMLLGTLSGAHIILQSFGVLDSIMTTSYEKFVIDEEMFARVLRFTRGLDPINPETDFTALSEIGPKGSFLMHPTTLENYKSFHLPIHDLSCWGHYESWVKKDKEDILLRANRKWKEIVESAPDMMIDPQLDRVLNEVVESAANSPHVN